MARTNPAGERWAKWLKGQLLARDWRQIDLVNASNGELKASPVSKWLLGENAADARMAFIAARALRADPAVALREAGHEEIADFIDAERSETQRSATEPIDDTIAILLAAEALDDDERADLIRLHQARRKMDHESARAAIENAERRRRNAG